jgi:hypothetical protein
LGLRSNERLACIVAPSILYDVFHVYAISKALFWKDLRYDAYYKNEKEFESKASM